MKFKLYAFDGEDTQKLTIIPECAYQETYWELDNRYIPETKSQYAALDETGKPVIRWRENIRKPDKKWFSRGRNHQEVSIGHWTREIEVTDWFIDIATIEDLAMFMQKASDINFCTIPPSINMCIY